VSAVPGQRPSLEEVADRLAVDDLLDAYAAALDARDWEALRALFLPDAVVDYTEEGGPRGSIDQAIAWLREALAPFAACQHLVTNRRVRIDGDEATVEAYVFSPLGAPTGGGKLALVLAGGAYRDVLRRTPEGWRFASRAMRASWFHAGLEGRIAPPGATS
jgi:hypothetical protein